MSTIIQTRIWQSKDSTLSTIRVSDAQGSQVVAFALEDGARTVKEAGWTRIPAGIYELKWRTSGRWAARFKKHGMPGSLELCDVPGFTDVLVHFGNQVDDTEGCVLPGLQARMPNDPEGNAEVFSSTPACVRIYDRVRKSGNTHWMWQIKEHF